MNYNFRKFKKNAKGLSPVVASIILIAVTVAVSVVVAAWLSGMAFGFMGNAEQVSITDAQFASNGATLLVNVHNTGTATVTIKTAYIDTHQTPDTWSTTGTVNATIAKGDTTAFTITVPNTVTMNPGASYQVKIMTAKGTSLTYQVGYNP